MKELKNSTCCKSKFEDLLCNARGNFIYNGAVIAKQSVVLNAKKLAACLQPGEIISNSLNNCPEWWIVTLAAMLAGATVVVYPNEKNKHQIISDNQAYSVTKAFFTDTDVQSFISSSDALLGDFPCNGRVVLFTSGTQAVPKGVVIEMYNYVPNVIATQGRLHMDLHCVDVGLAPYSHAMGFLYGSCDFFFGGDFVICTNPLEFTNYIISGKPNIACMQPVYLESMIRLDKFVSAVCSMRYVLVGGAPMGKYAYDFYCKRGAKIVNAYGMTECVAGIAITDAISNNNQDGSLDVMESSVIEICSDGEIIVSGPTVCERYLDGSSIASKDGWYHTHDVGYIQDGLLYVTGRKDNVIICENGYKISLESIDDKLTKLDGIDACVTDYVDKCLVVEVVTQLKMQQLHNLVDAALEYYEKPFKLKIVQNIEVHNGKKQRKYRANTANN